MHGPGSVVDRIASLEMQFLEFRAEVRGEFFAVRQDIHDLAEGQRRPSESQRDITEGLRRLNEDQRRFGEGLRNLGEGARRRDVRLDVLAIRKRAISCESCTKKC